MFSAFHAEKLSRRVLLAAAGAFLGAPPLAAQTGAPPLRFGLSEGVVAGMNINDARAAMRVWLRRVAGDLQVQLALVPEVFESFERIESQLRQGGLDAVGIDMIEYRQLARLLSSRCVVVPAQRDPLSYVVLVKQGAGIKTIAGLRGRRLMMLTSQHARLAPHWLSTLLHAQENSEPAHFFSSVTAKGKPSQVILPVFFGQADACVVTRHGFLTMGELNPQVTARLDPIAQSPQVVAMLYAFRRDVDEAGLQKTLQILGSVPQSAAGRQLLALFQFDRLEARGLDSLKDSLAILDEAAKIGRQHPPSAAEWGL
ncbi:MAG: PhnD/SsuA/transferrin family substrate-binding protein [Bryobacterales bacterium]|nr:PhnD/SsuA/transferrin family substrate-binding protein [Bryobacterales bacterium]